MASESWYSIGKYLNTKNQSDEILSENQLNTVIKCGEDLMVGSFILTKINGYSFLTDMKKAILAKDIDIFKNAVSNLPTIFSGQQINKYFDHCIQFGHNQAL